jgi:hypothetical protein
MTTLGITGTTGLGTSYQTLASSVIGVLASGQLSSVKQQAAVPQQTTTTTTTAGTKAAGTQTTTTQASQTLASAAGTGSTGTVLSAQQKAQIAQFQLLDQTARANVAAEQRAAGAYGGTVSYQYERGPDGTLYAVAGDVTLNVQPVPNNPAATLSAMQTITNAALSVAPPTADDLMAVREAAQYTAEAEAALRSAQAGTATAATTNTANGTTATTGTKTATTNTATATAAQTKAARQQAVTAATATVIAAQQQAVGSLYGITGHGFAAYAAAAIGTPANQAGGQLTQAA